MNLADQLSKDLEDLREKYADQMMQTSDFIGCLEVFKFQILYGCYADDEEELT